MTLEVHDAFLVWPLFLNRTYFLVPSMCHPGTLLSKNMYDWHDVKRQFPTTPINVWNYLPRLWSDSFADNYELNSMMRWCNRTCDSFFRSQSNPFRLICLTIRQNEVFQEASHCNHYQPCPSTINRSLQSLLDRLTWLALVLVQQVGKPAWSEDTIEWRSCWFWKRWRLVITSTGKFSRRPRIDVSLGWIVCSARVLLDVATVLSWMAAFPN